MWGVGDGGRTGQGGLEGVSRAGFYGGRDMGIGRLCGGGAGAGGSEGRGKVGRPWRGKQSGGTLLEGALRLKVPEGWGLGGFREISWAWRVCQLPKYPQCARPTIIFE